MWSQDVNRNVSFGWCIFMGFEDYWKHTCLTFHLGILFAICFILNDPQVSPIWEKIIEQEPTSLNARRDSNIPSSTRCLHCTPCAHMKSPIDTLHGGFMHNIYWYSKSITIFVQCNPSRLLTQFQHLSYERFCCDRMYQTFMLVLSNDGTQGRNLPEEK